MAVDLKYVIRHFKKLLLCIHISGINCSSIDQVKKKKSTFVCTKNIEEKTEKKFERKMIL